MATEKWTAGPWLVGTMGYETDMETQIGCLREDKDTEKEWQPIGFADENGFAGVIALAHLSNANLIAAAPELYDMLKAAVDIWGDLVDSDEPMSGANAVDYIGQLVREARPLLAKTRGEQ